MWSGGNGRRGGYAALICLNFRQIFLPDLTASILKIGKIGLIGSGIHGELVGGALSMTHGSALGN
jgi:hypothetical protein